MSSRLLMTLARATSRVLPVWALLGGSAFGATLLFDDFSGSSLNEALWRLPVGDGTFYGRTQIKPPAYGGQDLRPVVAGGSVTLQLDTYNASSSSANTFWGQEIQSLQAFLPGTQGVSIETRMRFIDTPPGGLVGGFFTWGYNGTIRDEIDIELLTNDLARERILTNVFNDDTFNDAGDSAFAGMPAFDMTQWNSYEILWLPDRIQWLLNGTQVREQIVTVADNPSEVRLNIWAPDNDFVTAFNSALQPTDLAGNQQYKLEIDYVRVSSVPVPPALLLFSSALALLAWAGRWRNRENMHRTTRPGQYDHGQNIAL
jgi:hypothetical protein